jgi:hypothetical protein
MLDLVYIGLVALPLTIAAVSLLLLAWRAVRGEGEAPAPRVRAAPRVPAARPERAAAPEPAAPRDLAALLRPAEPLDSTAISPRDTKRCPDCAEEVLAAARVCKHCRYRFDEPDFRSALSA